ncbi:MAG: hypothetical protein IJY99_04560 [Alphaproteobacteria bacterium]|nr:hypothetical protein [Alphaproteobacteria bacterium]
MIWFNRFLFCVLMVFVPVCVCGVESKEQTIKEELKNAITWRQVDFALGYYGDNIPSFIITQDFERRLNSDWGNEEQVKILQTLLQTGKVDFSRSEWDHWLAGWYSTLCAAQNPENTGHPVYEAKRKFVKLCLIDLECGIEYNSRGAFRYLFEIEAIKKKYQDFYICLFSQLAQSKKSKAEKIELLDYAIEQANEFDNVLFGEVGKLLKEEIEKVEDGD